MAGTLWSFLTQTLAIGGGGSFCFFGFGTYTLHWKASFAARKSSTTWARSSRWSSLSRQDDFPLNQRSQETPQEMSSRMGANDVLCVDVGDVTLWASFLGWNGEVSACIFYSNRHGSHLDQWGYGRLHAKFSFPKAKRLEASSFLYVLCLHSGLSASLTKGQRWVKGVSWMLCQDMIGLF